MTTTYSDAANAYVYNRRAHGLGCSCALCVGERAAFDAGAASVAPVVPPDPDADVLDVLATVFGAASNHDLTEIRDLGYDVLKRAE